jgi:Arrestin (or S-antigen), N-terminal domain
MIDIRLHHNQVMAGETLTGSFSFYPDSQKTVKEAIASIGWRTEGRGTVDQGKVQEITFDPTHFANGSGSVPFKFQLPSECPISVDGQLIRIIWEVSVKLDIAGIFAKDHKHSQVFRVLPRQVNAR